MADIKKFLREKGYTDEQLAGMDAKMLGDLTDLAVQMEEGITARQRAEQIKADLEVVKGQWNEYVLKSDTRTAKAEAELAKQKTFLKELKTMGYPVPDAYLEGSDVPPQLNQPGSDKPAAAAASPNYSDEIFNAAKANMALISMSNKYRALTGSELDPEMEYEDFNKNRRPNENLRTYIDRKYDLGAKEAAKAEEKKKAYEDGIRAEARKAALAEFQQANGANPETRNPKTTKFDVIRKDEGRANTWNRAHIRGVADSVDKRRIEKYASQLPN